MITFSCPLCGAMLTSEDASATAYCPSCTNTVIIPAEARHGNDLFAPTATPSTPPEPDWLDETRRELRQGNKIAAIKIYKDNTGVGLKEAKDAVEAMQAGVLPTLPLPVAAPVDQMAEIEQAMRAGRKIEAIKLYREMTGLGLKEAKDAVEELERRQPAGLANPSQLIPPQPPTSASGCFSVALLALVIIAGIFLASQSEPFMKLKQKRVKPVVGLTR